MNQFGHNFRLAIWGESHGHQIGISLDDVPAGIPLSEEDFAEDLARRRSGAPGTTPRREPDVPQIVSESRMVTMPMFSIAPALYSGT